MDVFVWILSNFRKQKNYSFMTGGATCNIWALRFNPQVLHYKELIKYLMGDEWRKSNNSPVFGKRWRSREKDVENYSKRPTVNLGVERMKIEELLLTVWDKSLAAIQSSLISLSGRPWHCRRNQVVLHLTQLRGRCTEESRKMFWNYQRYRK